MHIRLRGLLKAAENKRINTLKRSIGFGLWRKHNNLSAHPFPSHVKLSVHSHKKGFFFLQYLSPKVQTEWKLSCNQLHLLWTPFMIMQKCKWDVSLSDFQILRKNSQVCMYFVEPRLSVGRGNSGPLEEWTQEFCSVTLVGLSLKRIVLPNSSMLLT